MIGSLSLITFLPFANTVCEPSLGIGIPECVRQPTGGGGGIMCTELNPVVTVLTGFLLINTVLTPFTTVDRSKQGGV